MTSALLRTVAALMICVSLAACETAGGEASSTGSSSASSLGPRAPREVRTGVVDSAIQNVEPDVSPGEVAAAVREMVAQAPVCASWPSLWLQDAGRRTAFLVRYDLMTRDWGNEGANAARERMNEFVSMGLLTPRERPEIGPGVVEYSLTEQGRLAMRGWPTASSRASFCAPSERRLLAITSTEFGRFPCGNLRVRFSHVADSWPSWAANETTRTRLAGVWPPLGTVSEGTVTLTRQWYNERALPPGVTNGALRSVCIDNGRVAGDDLELFPGAY